ncbi:MAG: alpha/beta fold hydrolase [Sphingomicrobium sp.]
MDLSVTPRLEVRNAEDAAIARASSLSTPLTLFDVPVPRDLTQFGQQVLASGLGNPLARPVVVLGGISADCFPAEKPDGSPGWWSGLVGEGRAVDPGEVYVIGMDFAADESGATAPSTVEQARILAAALDCLGIRQPAIIVGASYGAMVGMALVQADPARVDRLVIVSASAAPHPASTAARELQRRVVALGLEAGRGEEALVIARGMAMLTYRTASEFDQRFEGGIAQAGALSCSPAGAYLRARGEAFASAMSPGRFISLSASIDRHRVHPERIAAPCLVIGADSDQLVFAHELRQLAAQIAGPTQLHVLDSIYGHDMFLKESARVGGIVGPFLAAAG